MGGMLFGLFLVIFFGFGFDPGTKPAKVTGWRQLRLYAKSFLVYVCGFRPAMAYWSSARDRSFSLQIRWSDRRPRQFHYPVAFSASSGSLGISALWLYVFDGMMFLKASSLRGFKKKAGVLGLYDGLCKASPICLKHPPSCNKSRSLHILNTPRPYLVIPASSGSSYIVNTPPIHHMS